MNRSTASRTDPGPLFGFYLDTRRRSTLSDAALAFAAMGLVFALIRPVASAGADELSWATRVAVLAGMLAVFVGIAGSYVAATRGIGGRAYAKIGMAVGAVVAVFAFVDAAVRDGTLRPGRFVSFYFDWDVIKLLPGDFARGVVNTVKAAATAEVFAIAVGILVATFALSTRRRLRWPALVYVEAVRGLPLVVLTFLINFGLPFIGITLATFVSVTTILTVNASAYVAEIFRAGIQSLPRGQMDAARSLGMPHETAMTTVIIPQATRAVIPPLVSEFIALLKDTAIVFALVGITPTTRDLFGAAQGAAASTFSPTPYMLAAFVYLALTVPTSRIVGRLERRLRARVA